MLKRIISHLIIVLPIGLQAQSAVTSNSCILAGAGSIQEGTVATYILRGCHAADWTVSTGVINAKTDSNVTVFLNSTSGSTLTITALNGGSTIAAKNVTLKPAIALNGGAITSANQAIGWRRVPAMIGASPAKQGSCNGIYTYQWYRSTDGVHFDSIPGAIAVDYQPGPLDSTTYFKRRSSGSGSMVFTNNIVRVSVQPKITATTITPAVQMLDPDSLPMKMTITGVIGGNNVYTYQWQSTKAGDNLIWQPIAGATSTDYTPGTLDTSRYYRVLIQSNGDSTYSPEAVIDIYPPLAGGVISPVTQTVASDSIPQFLMVAGLRGGAGGYAYQWFSSADGISWDLLDGVTTEGYGPPATSVTTYYRAAVSSDGKTVYSEPAQVIVSSGNSNQ